MLIFPILEKAETKDNFLKWTEKWIKFIQSSVCDSYQIHVFYISDINVSVPNIDFENVSNDIKTLKLTLCDNYPLR